MSKPHAFNAAVAETAAGHAARRTYLIQVASAGLPDSSWWVCAREEFAARAKAAAVRMTNSQLGNNVQLIHAKDTEKVERE